KRLATFRLPGSATSATLSRDGRLLLTTTGRGSTLWHANTGHHLATLEKRAARAGAFSPDGHLVATLDTGKRPGARVFDTRTGRGLALAWSPDGQFLADASADRTLHVLSANGTLGGRIVGTLVGHGDAVRAVAWSPDGRALLSGSVDRTARLWDARFDQELL